MHTETILENLPLTQEEILQDYRTAYISRQASLIGRKEVFMGKAKFGIFGDGKEVPQLAMARVFKNGDFRSGYYRDQTFMMAIGELSVQAFFAQLYAHTDVEADPSSAGRCMNSHFATRSMDENGHWKRLTDQKNSSSDISPTAGQVARLVGLAFASKLYRQNKDLHHLDQFSINGNEIAFGTIGNASCAEGVFFEAINAAGVLQIPMLMSIWDDGYGISVPNKYQIAKESISDVLAGFQRDEERPGFEIFKVKAWDYMALLETYRKAEKVCREEHVPVIIHVVEVTQPQGHSTSGSHERYKSKERLEWENEYDCVSQMRQWIEENDLATLDELNQLEKEALQQVKAERKKAWDAFLNSMKPDHNEALELIATLSEASGHKEELQRIHNELKKALNPIRQDAIKAIKKALRAVRFESNLNKKPLQQWLERVMEENHDRYSSTLYCENDQSALNVTEVKPSYSENSNVIDGREVLQATFDKILTRDARVYAIGEDVGKIGDVNQGFAGLQEIHGDLRVSDTGIREATILGQGIGTALRGLRPIVEIQYLDYVYYAIQTMTDDLACLNYRTKGGQVAPVIIRTRGHRLEGIWHSGSPMGAILHACRGIYVLVPRNMTKAAGFYNTMLESDDPALIVECLNGYRLKEKLPENLNEIKTPLGIPEVIREGNDVTIVTYGSMCRIIMDAASQLAECGIECEIIDVQSLLPFDLHHGIVKSIQKTNRVIFADEDVPGGTSAYMMQKVLDEQNAYRWLDSKPVCLAAKEHRPAYASDGDYFSKPSIEEVFDTVYATMHETDPEQFPAIYG